MSDAEAYDKAVTGMSFCPLFDGARPGSPSPHRQMCPADWLLLGVCLAQAAVLWDALPPAVKAARLADDGRPIFMTMGEMAFESCGLPGGLDAFKAYRAQTTPEGRPVP